MMISERRRKSPSPSPIREQAIVVIRFRYSELTF